MFGPAPLYRTWMYQSQSQSPQSSSLHWSQEVRSTAYCRKFPFHNYRKYNQKCPYPLSFLPAVQKTFSKIPCNRTFPDFPPAKPPKDDQLPRKPLLKKSPSPSASFPAYPATPSDSAAVFDLTAADTRTDDHPCKTPLSSDDTPVKKHPFLSESGTPAVP